MIDSLTIESGAGKTIRSKRDWEEKKGERGMRRDVSFRSKGLCCRGWLYVPESLAAGQTAPTVVMAHGFSGVKEMFLAPFAEHFAAAGMVVLVFDYRYLGESEGEPRGQILPLEQQEDYRNAITWVAQQPEVDAERIGLWGTSYSGGHVLHIGAFDPRVKAVVAQAPAICTWRQVLSMVGREGLRGLLDFVGADRLMRFETGAVNYVKVIPTQEEFAALATPDAIEWFQKAASTLAPTWRNEVTMESIERLLEYDPAGAIELIAPTPVLIIAAEQDLLIPIDSVRAAFARAGEPKELLVLPCRHFDVYATEPFFSRAVTAATEWFRKHLA